MVKQRIALAICLQVCALFLARAADRTFSGPQPGERTTSFRVLSMDAKPAAAERDPVSENGGKPMALVFLHGLERSFVPLLRVIDEYGAIRKDFLRTEIIFLSQDRVTGEERMRAARNSLKLKSNTGLSLDGAEGPGNYGLNKDCLMTIVISDKNQVTDNFALIQPGIADAPKVLQALAKASGDQAPPTVEALSGRIEGMRDRRAETRTNEAKDPFPGAVPTDPTLNGLVRRFIRPTNNDATVDQILSEIKTHVGNDTALKKQALDGFTRVLHFGERYGTPYSRKAAADYVQSLEKTPPP